MGKTLQTNKVDKVSGKSLLSDSEIARLSTLSNYVHPSAHSPNIIAQDSENRFVSDAEKANWNAKQASLGFTPENASNKNNANGYAGLGADGKLISSQLPAITVNDTFVVASEAAMLTLTAETGDIAVRTDLSKSFILKGSNSSLLNDWQELLTPTSEVTKVFGRNGAVTAQAGDYNADQITETASRKFQSAAQQAFNDATSSIQTQLNSKASATGSGASGTWAINVTGNANTAGGLAVHSSTNNEANKIVRTDDNGYIQAGWINTISGDAGATPINRIFASNDQYLRYYTPANFINALGLATTATNRWYDGWANFDANTIGGSKSGFTYANNAPENGPLVHFDAGGYGLQLNSVYAGNEMYFRSRNGDTNSWNRWNRIWHDGNDSSLLKASPNSSSPINSNFAIGTESSRNFIQSHNGSPLDINPLGNTVTINGNTALHVGNFNPNNVVQGENARGRSISKNSGNANNSDETNPSGFFYGNTVTGMPNSDWWNWINIAGGDWSGADGYGFQIANSFWNGNLISRNMSSGSWSGWRTILDTENLINYVTKLNGSNASGTWPISVTGNSKGFLYQSGYQIDTLTGDNSTIVREEHPSSGFNYTSTLHMGSGDGRQQLTIARDGSGMKFRGSNSSNGTTDWTSWKTVLTDTNYSAFSTFSGAITTAQAPIAGNFGSLNLWAGSSYPTLFSSHPERWIMHANPHICYTENGQHGYTGSMTGATIRFAADPNASSSWDLGIGTNGVGRDSFSIGKNGSSYFRLSPNTGTADFNISVVAPVFYGSGSGLTGTAGSLNIGGNAETSTSSRRIAFTDGPRTLSDRLPNTFARSVNFDFVNSAVVGGSGNYGGVMTFAPWEGTSASTGDSSYQLAFRNETGVNGSGLPGLRLRKGIDTTWNQWYDILHSGNYASFSAFSGAITGASLTVTGDVTAFSDARVKENIRPIENAIERIQASRGVVYDRIDNEQKDNIGFIAQELEENFPELVLTREDGTKAVKYQNAVAVLFEAVKEQQAQIEEQDRKLKLIVKHLNLNQ